jgi:hypothetical protein
MAVTTTGWFSNAIQGIPQVGADFDIFDKHATARYAVGTRVQRQDGNEYVYSHFGADTNRGLLVAQDISESGESAVVDNALIAPASAVTTSDGTIGSKFIQMTNASITADQFAGGYFTGDPTTGDIRIELHDPLQVAIDNTTDVMITGSLYANLEAATSATDHIVAGVTVSTMDVSAQAYGWIQTKGNVAGLVDGTIAGGEMVTLSDGVSGAFQVAGGGSTAVVDLVDELILGQCLVAAGASTEHAAMLVQIS